MRHFVLFFRLVHKLIKRERSRNDVANQNVKQY